MSDSVPSIARLVSAPRWISLRATTGAHRFVTHSICNSERAGLTDMPRAFTRSLVKRRQATRRCPTRTPQYHGFSALRRAVASCARSSIVPIPSRVRQMRSIMWGVVDRYKVSLSKSCTSHHENQNEN